MEVKPKVVGSNPATTTAKYIYYVKLIVGTTHFQAALPGKKEKHSNKS
jgi:hypothetical protein